MLTQRLRHKDDPIRLFLDDNLINFESLRRQWKELGPIRINPLDVWSWSLIGMALDYRIRYFFENFDVWSTIAPKGAVSDIKLRETFWKVARDLGKFCDASSPVGRLLPSADEAELLRYCYVLAIYETNYRSSSWDSLLRTLRNGAGSRAQLNRVPDADLNDLMELSAAAFNAFQPLMGRSYRLNPVFSGSSAVGGADADLIVDHNLIEVKVERSKFEPYRIRQVVSYALLDLSRKFELTECSIYVGRWGRLLTWGLDELISELSNGTRDFESLQRDFADLLLPERERQRVQRKKLWERQQAFKDEFIEIDRLQSEFHTAWQSGELALANETGAILYRKYFALEDR